MCVLMDSPETGWLGTRAFGQCPKRGSTRNAAPPGLRPRVEQRTHGRRERATKRRSSTACPGAGCPLRAHPILVVADRHRIDFSITTEKKLQHSRMHRTFSLLTS